MLQPRLVLSTIGTTKVHSLRPCIRLAGRTHAQLFRTSTRHASTRPPAIPKAAPAPVVEPQTRIVVNQLSVEQHRRVKLIEELYAQGKTTLYKAPRRLTYFRLQCWTLIGIGMSFITWYFESKLYDAEELKRQGVKYPWLTTVGETAAAGLVCLVVGFCAYRTINHVQIIQLVKEMDIIFVRLSTRSLIPFVKAHVAVRPYNLAISDRLVMPRSPPQSIALRKLNESSVSALIVSVMGNTLRAVPLFFWHVVNEARRFLTSDGFVNARIVGDDAKSRAASEGYYVLDVDGQWLMHKSEWAKKENLALYDVGRTDRF